MINSFDRFIVQLNAYRKMVEQNDKKSSEVQREMDIPTITDVIINRKKIQRLMIKDTPATEKADKEVQTFIKFSDDLIKKNKFARKLDDAIIIAKDEDGKLIIKSNPPSLLGYCLSEVSRSDRPISKYEEDELLYQSLAVSLCSALENFASTILKEYYYNYHGGDLVDGRNISFKLMKNFEDIDEVRVYLIDVELEGIFRKSFVEWLKEVDERTELCKTFPETKGLIEELNELFQRRNLYVHSNGTVNQIYLHKTQDKYRSGVKLGDKVIISKEYLLEKIIKVEALGLYMFYAYHKKLVKEEGWFLSISNRIVSMLSNKNDAIPVIFSKGMEDKSIGNLGNLYATVNYFLYYYENGRMEEVKSDLEKHDFTVYSLQFRMARAILLDSAEKHDLIREYFETISEEGDFLSVYNWPLMKKSREEEPSKAYFEERFNLIFSDDSGKIDNKDVDAFENSDGGEIHEYEKSE